MLGFTTNSRSVFILRLTLVFWFISKAISWRAWTTHHLFPLAPIFDLFTAPGWVHTGLFIISVAAAVLLLIRPDNRYLLLTLLVSEIISCTFDQLRWQPWEYQYLFFFFVFLINGRNRQQVLSTLLLIMASTYLYGGLQKMNWSFIYWVYEYVILGFFFKSHSPYGWPRWVAYGGYGIPILEILMGIGLFVPRLRRPAAVLIVIMHAFNLLVLGPWGRGYNPVIWPWNIMMAICIGVLCLNPWDGWQPNLRLSFRGWNKVVILFWLILPAFSFRHHWDSYFSSDLYSGKSPMVIICVNKEHLPTELQPYLEKKDTYGACNGQSNINLQLWAMKEMNMMPNPELRAYKKVKEGFMAKYPDAQANFNYSYFPFTTGSWKELP